MKKYIFSFLVLFSITGIFFREILIQNKVALPADTLVGAYLPWLDYKWGYTVGVPVKNALLSDSFSHFFIYKYLVADLVKQGIIPLWNKYSLAGTPLLAAYHTNPFFPANFLLLLPKFIGWNLFIYLSTLFASFSMYIYLDKKIKSKVIKIIASLIYCFFGPMTTWSEFGTAVWAASIIPLVLYSLDLVIIHKKNLGYYLFSIFVCLLIFAGHLQLDTYTALIIPIYSLVQIKSQLSRNRLRTFLKICLFGFIGVGLSAIELLPAFDLYRRSIRGEENYAQGFHYGLVSFNQLIRLYVPNFFGHPTTGNQWGDYIYHEYSSFIGTLSLPFIFVIFFSRSKESVESILFKFIFIASLILVTLNPLSLAIFSLPIPLLTFSSASRLFFITGLSGSILFAYGLEKYIQDRQQLNKLRLSSSFLIGLLVFSLLIVPHEFFTVSLRNSLMPMFLLFSLAVLSFFKIPRKIFLLALLIVFSLDLGSYYNKYNPFIDRALVFPETPVIAFLKNQPGLFRIAREKINLLPPNTWAYYHLESIEGYEPLRPLNYSRFFHLLENGHFLNNASRYSELQDINPKYLSMMNVKYFLVAKSSNNPIIDKLETAGYKEAFSDKSVVVLENKSAQSRVFFVDTVKTVKSDADLATALDNPQFEPSKTALITEPAPDVGPDPNRFVKVVTHEDNHIVIETKSKSDQFIVISDTFDPGWQAKVDGQLAKIYETDGALRGISLSMGEHQVTLDYLPQLFIMGLKISLISVLLLILTSFIFIYERRSSSKLQ